MSVSMINACFEYSIEDVWNTVTSMENYSWRSDLDRIEVVNDRQFIEYTKDGYATYFTTTVWDPCKCWEFDMENSNMKGHWIGIFSENNGQTCIEFTEIVTAKKLIIQPFVKWYLKKQQKRYLHDLQEALRIKSEEKRCNTKRQKR